MTKRRESTKRLLLDAPDGERVNAVSVAKRTRLRHVVMKIVCDRKGH